ncbi:hypothetical protein [Cupriavidus sp. L7L]|uniref:hypothetical protein n=1 Tax=Cupriavidus sp. L7L TaxID=2546443 RepID=UPI00105494E0|nr:hypothetical protein [Cupriavidus sp. L7L]TDF66137.1 hypothetical protein E1J61_09900 [Cupriavidus sp. L7L]
MTARIAAVPPEQDTGTATHPSDDGANPFAASGQPALEYLADVWQRYVQLLADNPFLTLEKAVSAQIVTRRPRLPTAQASRLRVLRRSARPRRGLAADPCAE